MKLLGHFEFRNHVALVFDYQQMNLRETLKKFGKDVGINISSVVMYARQLLVALKHLFDCRIVHADVKLDNILCSGDLKQIKLCDFGKIGGNVYIHNAYVCVFIYIYTTILCIYLHVFVYEYTCTHATHTEIYAFLLLQRSNKYVFFLPSLKDLPSERAIRTMTLPPI